MASAAIHERPAGIRGWYANWSPRLGDSGVRRVWAAFVILPLIIVVFYSFFPIKNYQVVYEPTFATWISLIESGAGSPRCARCGSPSRSR